MCTNRVGSGVYSKNPRNLQRNTRIFNVIVGYYYFTTTFLPFTIRGKTSDYRTFSQNTFNNATLYVPVGTKEKYQATDGWKEFQNIVEGTPTGIKVIENTQNKNATVYDLNGVRLSEPKKGINIINGQKVVMK